MSSRIRRSLTERARFFAKRERVQNLCAENGIPHGDWDLDLLQSLLSIRAIAAPLPELLIDVGAHYGMFTKAAAAVLGIRRALCVEPDADLIPEIKANNPDIQLDVANVAIGASQQNVEFFVHQDRSMSSIVPADVAILKESFATYSIDATESRIVPQITLDELLVHHNVPCDQPLFIKLDTQGSELTILRSGPRAVAQTKVALVEFMFCTPYATDFRFEDLVGFMHSAGLNCAGAVDIRRRQNHRVSGVDFLFVRP